MKGDFHVLLFAFFSDFNINLVYYEYKKSLGKTIDIPDYILLFGNLLHDNLYLKAHLLL